MPESILHAEKIYPRPRISALLDRAARGALVVVAAPAGYGKTTAIADYLASAAWDYTVVGCNATDADNHVARFWKRLCDALVLAGADASILEKITDPGDADPSEMLALFADAIQSLKAHLRGAGRWHPTSRIAVVLDDFHLIYSPSILRFVAGAASLGLRKLKFFVISRALPVFSARVPRMLVVGARELAFDRDEVEGWLAYLHPKIASFGVMRHLDGRISDMQMLAALDTEAEGEPIAADNAVLESIFKRYAPEVQTFLIRISVLEEFSTSLCAAAARCKEATAARLMGRVADAGILVSKGAIHHILRDFLRGLSRPGDEDERVAALRRAAEWYRAHNDPYAAANCCARARDFGTLSHLIAGFFQGAGSSGMQLNEFARDEFRLRRKLFECIPTEVVRQETPLLELMYVFTLILLRDMEALTRRMAGIRAHYAPMPESPVRNRILGELELMGTTLVYNDFESKAAAFDRARALLGGPSMLARSPIPVIFGSPSALALYYNEFRPLDDIVSAYARHWEKNDEMLGGAFTGLKELTRGEAAYERADFTSAERLAGLAMEKARQNDVAVAAHFLRVRCALAAGRFDGVLAGLRGILKIAMAERRPQECSTVDFSFGLVGAMLGEPEIVPAWLRRGELERSRGMAVGIGVRLETFPYAFLLAACGRYDELARILPEIRAGYECAQTRIGLLHCAIYEAILHDAAARSPAAEEALRAAWRMAMEDGLIMPFVERSARLYPLVRRCARTAKGEKPFAEWLVRMEDAMKRRNRTISAMRRTYFARREMWRKFFGAGEAEERDGDFLARALLSALSPREMEVYALREAGVEREEIAARLGIRRGNANNLLLLVEEKTGPLRGLEHAGVCTKARPAR